VVVASGYFDPLHYGHIEYLQKSKDLGDTLIVIINNDKQASLTKGGSLMPVRERLKLVRSLGCVDACIQSLDEDRSVCKTLELLHPDIFANGGTQFNDLIPEAELCSELGIRLVDRLGNQIEASSKRMNMMEPSLNMEPSLKRNKSLVYRSVPYEEVNSAVQSALDTNGGIILARRSMVHREMYNGRNILAPNSGPGNADHRGYVPVERWIMSKTRAENPVEVKGEGVSLLLTPDGEVRLDDACANRSTDFALFGPYSKQWPLTKVLDIGGELWQPSFAPKGALEVPPIPAHVHPGYTKNGVCCMKEGKLEAYFFPPIDESTVYAGKIADPDKVITRLGLKPDVTKDEVRKAFDRFGLDDSLYGCMKVYPIKPNTSWTIQPGMIHAPGPWPTFEIQRPQDDAHILAWKLGQPVKGQKLLSNIWSNNFKKNLRDADDVMSQTLHWEGSRDPKFEEKWFRPCDAIEEGTWGRRRRIFHHEFNGEGFEILPGQSYERPAGMEPYAALVWSGKGTVEAVDPKRSGSFEPIEVAALTTNNSEYLVTPQTAVRMTNTTKNRVLLIYTVLPISSTESWYVSPENWID